MAPGGRTRPWNTGRLRRGWPLTSFPESVLATEAAIRLGLVVRSCGYELQATPRPNGADLAAARRGTTWATFHLDVDRARPLLLRIGATVWGGARRDAPFEIAWDARHDPRLDEFARERLAAACRVGRSQDAEHCAECPEPTHRRP